MQGDDVLQEKHNGGRSLMANGRMAAPADRHPRPCDSPKGDVLMVGVGGSWESVPETWNWPWRYEDAKSGTAAQSGIPCCLTEGSPLSGVSGKGWGPKLWSDARICWLRLQCDSGQSF